MSRDADDRSRLRRTLATWAIVFAIAAAFAVGQVALNRQQQARWVAGQAAYQAERARLDAIDNAAIRAATDAYKSNRDANDFSDPPFAAAEATLNGGAAFERAPDGRLRWVDPATGGEAYLGERDGKWIGVAPFTERSFRLDFFTFFDARRGEAVQVARRLAYIGLLLLWPFVLFSLATPDRAARLRRAIHLLGVAVLATFLACLGPQYLRALRDFFQDDAAAWGWITIPTSAALVAWSAAPRRSDSDEPRCPRCGYNLTGNASGVCPECGTRVATTEVR